jgi:hypothetical protein
LYPCLVSPRASCFTAVVRLVYEHYAPAHPDLARHASPVAESDRLDSAQLTLEDVESPCGGPRGTFDLLLPAVRDRPVEEVVSTLERNG